MQGFAELLISFPQTRLINSIIQEHEIHARFYLSYDTIITFYSWFLHQKFKIPSLVNRCHCIMFGNVSKESAYEPPHDKTNKMTVRPAKTRISLGIHPAWWVFAVRMKKAWVLSYPLSTQWRLWSDWADAQADLSFRWAHTHFVGFVTRRLICNPPVDYCF